MRGEIWIIFLSPNVTSFSQPTDQSVMEPINKTYRTYRRFHKSPTEDLWVIKPTYASKQYYWMLACVGFVNKKRGDAKNRPLKMGPIGYPESW